MKENRDKYLTEAMGNSYKYTDRDIFLYQEMSYSDVKLIHDRTIWDEWKSFEVIDKNGVARHKPILSTWQGFGTLWEWAIKQEWWDNFLLSKGLIIWTKLINPDKFIDALYEFLKARE